MVTMVLHSNRDRVQHFRCVLCGARSCCTEGFYPCPSENHPGPFLHAWTPMGTRKPIIAHPVPGTTSAL